MKFNLFTDTHKGVRCEDYKLTFDNLCKLIEQGIDKGETFVIEILEPGFKQRVINDRIDYAEFVDEFGGAL